MSLNQYSNLPQPNLTILVADDFEEPHEPPTEPLEPFEFEELKDYIIPVASQADSDDETFDENNIYYRCDHCFKKCYECHAPLTCGHMICDSHCPYWGECPCFNYQDLKTHKEGIKQIKGELITFVNKKFLKSLDKSKIQRL